MGLIVNKYELVIVMQWIFAMIDICLILQEVLDVFLNLVKTICKIHFKTYVNNRGGLNLEFSWQEDGKVTIIIKRMNHV